MKLLGHSLGGAISFLYAASYPDEVEFMISLDIASPSVKDITKTPTFTGDIIDKFLKYELLQSDNIPSYTYEEVLDILEQAYTGSITKESAKILMKRGIHPSSVPERYFFSRDPRLKVITILLIYNTYIMFYVFIILFRFLHWVHYLWI